MYCSIFMGKRFFNEDKEIGSILSPSIKRNGLRMGDETLLLEGAKTRSSSILKSMLHLRQDNLFCDVTITCEDGTTFDAHGCLLAASSSYFKNCFIKDSLILSVDLPSNGVDMVIQYIYTSKLCVSKEDELLKCLLKCASYFQVADLVKLIRDYFDGEESKKEEERKKEEKQKRKAARLEKKKLKEAKLLEESMNQENKGEQSKMSEDDIKQEIEQENAEDVVSESDSDDDNEEETQECPICKKTLSGKKRSLFSHMRVHRDIKIHECPSEGCTYTTSRTARFKSHVYNMHPHEKVFHCDHEGCHFKTNTERTFKTHIVGHTEEGHPFKCDECTQGFLTENDLKKHKRLHSGERPFGCSVCFKTFATVGGLKLHSETHNTEKSHICSKCGMAFKYKRNLKDHVFSVHEGKRYHCNQCGKDYPSRSALASHKSKIHKKKVGTMKECLTCGAKFANAGHLKVHEMFHRVEKPHVCTICNKGFTQKNDLKRHEMIHTGVKPYLCSVCPFSTIRKHYLTKHEKSHNFKTESVTPYSMKPRAANKAVTPQKNVLEITPITSDGHQETTGELEEGVHHEFTMETVNLHDNRLAQTMIPTSHALQPTVQLPKQELPPHVVTIDTHHQQQQHAPSYQPYPQMSHIQETNMLLLSQEVPVPANNLGFTFPIHTSYAGHMPPQEAVSYVVVPAAHQQQQQDRQQHQQYQ